MALQVWLPLNGNLKNNGLSNLHFSNTNTSALRNITTISKIGNSCYQGTSSSLGALVSDQTIDLGDKQSFFCWIYVDNFDSTFMGVFGQHRYNKKEGIGLNVKYISATTGRLTMSIGNGSSRVYQDYVGNTILDAKKWYHVGITYDGAIIRFYVNGELDGERAYANFAHEPDYIEVFTWSLSGNTGNTPYNNYGFKGCLNDVRIYDECLSTKQIKEISKGLAAHYKFNWIGRENMLLGTEGVVFSRSGAVDGSVNSKAFSFPTFDASSLIGKKMTISVDIEAKNVIANEENGYHRAGAEISLRGTNGTIYIGAWQSFTTASSSVKKD